MKGIKFLTLAILILFLSCNNYSNTPLKDFSDKLLDFIIQNADDRTVEIAGLYDSLTTVIPEDKNEKVVMVELLKKRGFTVADWSRGNYPPLGPRFISIKMINGNCECEVDKIYYSTVFDTLYEMRERISCKLISVE